MDLAEALEKAQRILLEEQTRPTRHYRYVRDEAGGHDAFAMASVALFEASAASVLLAERGKRPREVYENPKLYRFESVNFDLLIRVFNQVTEADRPLFIGGLLKSVEKPFPAQYAPRPIFPSVSSQSSMLPLTAEFCIRTGYLKELLDATKKPQFPTASLAMMVMELEEMVALNFNLFSDGQLESMPAELAPLWEIAERQTYSVRAPRGKPPKQNPNYRPGYEVMGREIIRGIDGIKEECRKARYFYLKGALQELPNLEIESDRIKVEGFLVKLGFRGGLVAALDAAERDYKSTSTGFELKNCLGHLRSYIHRDAAKTIAATARATVEDRWGPALIYLRQQGLFTLQHEEFIAKLYTLISDESVHALGADRDYARLLRNVVIEYGLMFLTVLDKKGIKIPAPSP
jgi:hypothetical protein